MSMFLRFLPWRFDRMFLEGYLSQSHGTRWILDESLVQVILNACLTRSLRVTIGHTLRNRRKSPRDGGLKGNETYAMHKQSNTRALSPVMAIAGTLIEARSDLTRRS